MKTPEGRWLVLEEVDTTQRVAAQALLEGDETAVVFARHQTAGKGRLGRTWHSDPGASLTMSLIFRAYADHPRPYLLGMACALAAAGAAHCHVRWPNDLLLQEKKLGGILTELLPDRQGRKVPVVGIGINLNQAEFPDELSLIATSMAMAHRGSYDAEVLARQILERIALLPEPDHWSDLAQIWHAFDRTPGKRYRLPSGEMAVAVGVGSEGQLICSVDGESQSVLAAEALFGSG